MSLLAKREYYKPFEFFWAYESFETQQKMHWLPGEVSLHEDIKDWEQVLTSQEKDLLSQLFRFFVQADVDIAGGYIDKFLPLFKPPEVRMMLSTFAAMEGIHIQAYALLLDTVGMAEVEYSKFQDYKEMKDKHTYLDEIQVDTPADIARSLAVYSAFGEGLQLFSTFAILLNFQRFGKMKGMGQIVSWSIKDEQLHVESMIKLFHTFLDENPKVWNSPLKQEIYQACEDMVNLEDRFIDLAFQDTELEGLTKAEVKEYIRYIADRRLLQLGLKTKYKQKKNPLKWLDWIVNATEHTSFFENRSTSYARGALQGSWSEVWNEKV